MDPITSFTLTMVLLTNTSRAVPLVHHWKLVDLARVRAEQTCKLTREEMAVHKGFKEFALSPAFSKAFPNSSLVGENLAFGFSDPVLLHDKFMMSVKHRENIQNPAFKYLGIGRAYSCDRWVFFFAN